MRKCIGIMLIFLCAVTAQCLAEDFSAEVFSITQAGSMSGKIFVTQDKVRMEFPQAVSITRIDKRIVWMLMPEQRMYMEQPFSMQNTPTTSEKVPGEIDRKLLGQESVDGKMCSKYQVTYAENNRQNSFFQWIAPGISIPVKTAAIDNSWVMEYRNISTGPQDPSLFELPAGYQPFSMGGNLKEMMQGMAGKLGQE